MKFIIQARIVFIEKGKKPRKYLVEKEFESYTPAPPYMRHAVRLYFGSNQHNYFCTLILCEFHKARRQGRKIYIAVAEKIHQDVPNVKKDFDRFIRLRHLEKAIKSDCTWKRRRWG